MSYEADDIRYIIWNFEPYQPVWKDSIREVVYVKKWQKLMLPENLLNDHGPLADNGDISIDEWFVNNETSDFLVIDVLCSDGGGYPNAHDTRIASNMIRWLGTNAGQAYLHNAQFYTTKGMPSDISYLAAWTSENIRVRSFNRGSIPRDGLTRKFNEACPDSTVRDVEILDQVAKWLGGRDGQDYLQACEANIQLKFERRDANSHANGLKRYREHQKAALDLK